MSTFYADHQQRSRTCILLIRHAESEKNIATRFSGVADLEVLTPSGDAQSAELADAVAIAANGCMAVEIHAADSNRAILTAQQIASRLQAAVIRHSALRSISLGPYGGLTEAELAIRAPAFVAQLTLYRAGLLNAYHVAVPEGSEDHYAFEARVMNTINEVISTTSAELVIFVLHRSSLTAALIGLARRYFRYPSTFYGHVPLDFASISSFVLRDADLDSFCINESPSVFKRRLTT